MKQLDGKEMKQWTWEPINLSLPVLRELGAKWLVEMEEYFEENPQIIVNGFFYRCSTLGVEGEPELTLNQREKLSSQ